MGLKGLDGLPETTRRSIEDWRTAVKKAIGPKLVAIAVHGSAARGEHRPGGSDIDAVIVVRDATSEELRALRNPIRLGRIAARIEAVVLEADEIAGLAGVFPLLYESIRRHHVVIQGKDPFADLAPSDKNVRVRIEQELRDAQVRLRAAVVELSDDALKAAIDRKLEQLREPLRALLARKHKECDDSLEAVLRAACETWRVDLRALQSASPERAHAALSTLVERALGDVGSR